MPSASQFTWQLALYGAIALTYLGVATSLLTARSTLRKWLAASFLVIYLENVVGFMAALCGSDHHQWLLGHPDSSPYLTIVLSSMWITLLAFFVSTTRPRLPRLLNKLPPLRVAEGRLRTLLLLGSLFCAALSFILSAGGYSGYFMAEAYFDAPPAWRDTMSSMVEMGTYVNFVLLLAAYVRHGRITWPEWMLLLLWSAAGLATGFKMQVVFPFFCALLAAWLTNRLRMRHLALLALTLALAYAFVEPMRATRAESPDDNGLRALYNLISSGGVTFQALETIYEPFLMRIDSSTIAVEALEADRNGQLSEYRWRLEQSYFYMPLLAFVPRVVWPNKPLANLGMELSLGLWADRPNSVTPTTVVNSYLWSGYAGVLLNSVLTGYCLALAGLLLTKYLHHPLSYAPVLLLVPVLAMPTPIEAFHYISILRALVGVALFYVLARRVGLVRGDSPALLSARPAVGAQSQAMMSR